MKEIKELYLDILQFQKHRLVKSSFPNSMSVIPIYPLTHLKLLASYNSFDSPCHIPYSAWQTGKNGSKYTLANCFYVKSVLRSPAITVQKCIHFENMTV